MNSEKKYVLNLCTKTWIRDSHGLYDYESTQTRNVNAVLADSVIIVRKKHDIKTLPTKGDISDEEFLIDVKYEGNDRYLLDNPINIAMSPTEKNISELSNKIWYVLRPKNLNNNETPINNTNEDYYLCKNDIIKLGRVKYAINEIHIPDKMDNIDVALNKDPESYNISNININTSPVFDFIFQAKAAEGEDEDNSCKICYGTSNEPDNPLVHLCDCSGGIRYSRNYFYNII